MVETALNNLYAWLPKAGTSILVLLVFLVLSRVAGKAVHKAGLTSDLDSHVTSLLSRSVRIILVLVGVVSALGTLGINISAIVASLGLTGFALGFALKDTISNFLAGLLLLIYRPFTIADRIKVGSYEGIVISIDLRYTTLESKGAKILIPNSNLFSNPISIFEQK